MVPVLLESLVETLINLASLALNYGETPLQLRLVHLKIQKLENEGFQVSERVLPASWILFSVWCSCLGEPEMSPKGDRSFASGVPVEVHRSSYGVCASMKEPHLLHLHFGLSASRDWSFLWYKITPKPLKAALAQSRQCWGSPVLPSPLYALSFWSQATQKKKSSALAGTNSCYLDWCMAWNYYSFVEMNITVLVLQWVMPMVLF